MAMPESTKALIKEIAREVIKEYEEQNEKKINNAIALHSADCEAKKYRGVKSIAAGGIGGIIAAGVGWILKKL